VHVGAGGDVELPGREALDAHLQRQRAGLEQGVTLAELHRVSFQGSI